MAKRDDKLSRAAHIKRHTVGTSNEISFSVLDAAKNALDENGGEMPRLPRVGFISLFTLPGRRRKTVATPAKESELPISGSEPLPSSTPATIAPLPGAADSSMGAGAPSLSGASADLAATIASSSVSDPAKTSARSDSAWKAEEAGKAGRRARKAARKEERQATHQVEKAERVAVAAEKKAERKRAKEDRKEAEKLAKQRRREQQAKERASRTLEEEIAWRKARRRRARLAASAVIVLVLTAIAVTGTLYLQDELAKNRENVEQLHEAISLIDSADEVLIPLDELVNQPFDEEVAALWADLQEKVPDVQRQLAEAEEKAARSQEKLHDSVDEEASGQALAAIRARTVLLDEGCDVLETSADAFVAKQAIGSAWERVLAADALAREAALLASDTTADNVTASKDKNAEAIAAFEEAVFLFENIEEEYIDADLSAQRTYVEKRIEALGYAVASDEAFLARDTAAAVSQNDAYSTADQEAVLLADGLPDDPAQSIADACEEELSPLIEAYSTARLQAGAADAFLRDYLGTDSK